MPQAPIRSTLLAACLAAAAAAAHAGGVVSVTFVEPDKFADSGTNAADRSANLKVLEQHLKQLGQRYLGDGQSLQIEVTEVDLAGSTRPSRRSGEEIRIVRGMADWPRIELRYALEAGGQKLKSGEAKIADLNYTGHIASYGSRDPLRYEKQMLDAWFKATFAAPPAQ